MCVSDGLVVTLCCVNIFAISKFSCETPVQLQIYLLSVWECVCGPQLCVMRFIVIR